jgi:hypothetical protein
VVYTDTTDSNGYYEFLSLPPDNYQVTKTNPASTAGLDDADHGNPNVISLVLTLGTDIDKQDFEIQATTAVLIVEFTAYPDSGSAVVRWETGYESGTLGFHLERLDEESGDWLRLNEELLPSPVGSGTGTVYHFVDEGAKSGTTYRYRLIEEDFLGGEVEYGPYDVKVSGSGKKPSSKFDAEERKPSVKTVHRYEAAAKENKGNGGGNSGGGGGKPSKGDDISLKVYIGESGLYSVPAADIADGFGESADTVSEWIQAGQLLVTHRDKPVASKASADNSALLFYGEAIESYYTDHNVYWVHKQDGLEMISASGGSPEPSAEPGYYPFVKRVEQDVGYVTVFEGDPERDLWIWGGVGVSDSLKVGKVGVSAPYYLATPAPVTEEPVEACLTAYLKGANDDTAPVADHHVRLQVNGVEVGDEEAFDGIVRYDLEACFDQALLLDDVNLNSAADDNEIRLVARTTGGVSKNFVILDAFELTYQRYYRVDTDRIWVKGADNAVITVDGFGSNDIEVLSLADPLQPVPLEDLTVETSESGWRVSFGASAPGTEYLVQAVVQRLSPLELVPTEPNDLKDAKKWADHVVIAPQLLADSAQLLVDYRNDTGLKSKLVLLDQIYDSFNGGVMSPHAIKSFLAYASANWKKPPLYVALVGKGTLDPKDIGGWGDNLVPVLMNSTRYGMYACDSCYTDLDNDGIGEIALGRIPVLSNSEMEAYVSKLVTYETVPSGYAGDVLFAADNPDIAGNFWEDSDYLAGLVPPEFVSKAYIGAPPEAPLSPADVNSALVDGFGGKGVINWLGHGGLRNLAGEKVLDVDDVGLLSNSDDTPLFFALTCYIGRFELPGPANISLSEEMLVKEGGGAVAVISPSGQSLNNHAVRLNEGLLTSMYEDGEIRLGDLFIDAQQGYGAQPNPERFMLEIYSVMGDPATVIP